MRSTSRPETIAVFGKRRINQRLQDLQQGLLNQSIRHGRYSQFPHAATRLGNLHTAHRLRPVTTVLQRLLDLGPVGLEILSRSLDRQSIYPRTASIGLDTLPCQGQVLSREHLLKQVSSPRAFRFMPRQPCFITKCFRSGFTFPFDSSPRLPGLLMPCSAKQHGVRLSFSFGPSPRGYYGLC